MLNSIAYYLKCMGLLHMKCVCIQQVFNGHLEEPAGDFKGQDGVKKPGFLGGAVC